MVTAAAFKLRRLFFAQVVVLGHNFLALSAKLYKFSCHVYSFRFLPPRLAGLGIFITPPLIVGFSASRQRM